MRWAVLGSKGMLGRELFDFLTYQDQDVAGFHRGNLNLETQREIAQHLQGFDVVVNCIAYTDVDRAEREPRAAEYANVEIPSRIAKALAGSNTKLIHISTDYVFSGEGTAPYAPEDSKQPVGAYGLTKSAGEDEWLHHSASSQIVRTSWLYGKYGKCFPKIIANRLLTGEATRVVDDQNGSPTWTWDVSRFIFQLAVTPGNERIQHAVASGSTTWFGFAQTIASQMDNIFSGHLPEGYNSFRQLLSPVSSDDYTTAARRPRMSVLEPSRLGDFYLSDWETAWGAAALSTLADSLPRNTPNP